MQTNQAPSAPLPSRRDFLKSTSTAAAAGALASAVSFPSILRAQNAGDKLKLGWVGCGGRGTGAANQALKADSNVELWAVGEVFRDKIDSGLESLKAQFKDNPEKINVSEERKFVGLDAYKQVIDSGVDVVLLATSPGFRPLHIKAAVDAGKHVFAEKPMAVDGPGLRSVMESVKKAKAKKLAMVDGFVWRWTYANRDSYKRIHDGAIGDINAIYASYYTGSVDRYPKWNRTNTKTDLEWMLRRWYYFTWLSGDHVVEQAVHSVDKLMWTMKDEPPASCISTGGRQVKSGEEYGHIYDHFCAEYRWESGTRGYLFTRQFDKCAQENADAAFGSKGVYKGESGSKRHIITGENRWRWQAPEGVAAQNGYQTEHDEMYASIRAGNPINTGDRFCTTTLAAIMARMAAYTGKEITWEQALNSQEDTFPKDLKWDSKIPVPPVALPGITQFT